MVTEARVVTVEGTEVKAVGTVTRTVEGMDLRAVEAGVEARSDQGTETTMEGAP